MSQESYLMEQAFISLRIAIIDYYVANPIMDIDPTYSGTRSHVIKKVPVLRIFGTTPAGQKSCLHVHGIFPYIYVPVPAEMPENFSNKLANSLDRALNLSMGQADSRIPHIFKVLIVSGTPFYGYHPRKHQFLKIFFYNPMIVKKAADLLQNGGIMGMKLQPHESHVPYTLQFMMDYNLQGMNFIHLLNVRFRKTVKDDQEMLKQLMENTEGGSSSFLSDSQQSDCWPKKKRNQIERLFEVDSLPEELLMKDSVEKESTCELELDAVAADILNSNEGESGMNPGLESIWEDERVRRAVLDIDDPLTPPGSPPRDNACTMTDSEQFWQERYREKIEKLRQEAKDFVSESNESSSDPNATCNFLSLNIDDENNTMDKTEVYATETPELSSFPFASFVETHVESLSSSAMCGSSNTLPVTTVDNDYLDETIVDEEVVLSQNSSSVKSSQRFDDTETDLVDLLTELGTMRESSKISSQPSTSAAALAQEEFRVSREEEDERETFEMSQVFSNDDVFEELAKSITDSELERKEKEEKEVWGDDLDASFWGKMDLN